MEQDVSHVDRFIAAAPTANKIVFREHAEAAAAAFREHGALAVIECWGNDVPDGEVTWFPMAVKCRANETVCFSWILWPSRSLRRRTLLGTFRHHR